MATLPRESSRVAWTTVQRGHAVANGLPVIAVNRTGHEDDPSGQTRGIDFWGSSFVAGPQGELLHRAPINEEENVVVSICLAVAGLPFWVQVIAWAVCSDRIR